jgi:probable DNA repair protein
LIRNAPEIQSWLESGGTLVVPSRQRAAAVRLAYTAAMLARGAGVWDSPDILPWSAWLRRLEDLQPAADVECRQLNAVEEWLLWRESAQLASDDGALLSATSQARVLQQASELLDEWSLPASTALTDEHGLLLRARGEYLRRRKQLLAVERRRWRSSCEPLPQAVMLAGLDDLAPATLRQLQARGAQLMPIAPGVAVAAADVCRVETRSCEDPDDELRQIGRWCREQLQRDAGARLLVVVPHLQNCVPRLRILLSRALQAAALLGAVDDEPPFAIEGGTPLADYPLVRIALLLLHFAERPLEFAEFSAILRSSYLQLGAMQDCVRLELWLREQGVSACSLADLRTLEPTADAALGAGSAAVLRRLYEALVIPTTVREMPAWWARRCALVLQQCGWPGAQTLGSAELQVRRRFDELLGEWAATGDVSGALYAREAARLFVDWIADAALEPASDDVAVTVTDAIGDPLVRYDAIWVAGLSADAWPRPPDPDPWLPLQAQIAAGMPAATPTGRLHQAQRTMQAWERCCAQLVLSWPQRIDDVPMEPSVLLPVAGSSAVTDDAGDIDVLLYASSQLDAAAAPRAEAWPLERRLPGGTRLLELQADCPFRASAELRLGCRPLELPAPGIDARLRGLILHGALERFWRQIGHSSALRERSASANSNLVRECVAGALRQHADARALSLPPALLAIEAERTTERVLELLSVEREREPFAIEQLEWQTTQMLAGGTIQLRLDRLDLYADGRRAVIDFKSGAPWTFDALAERPSHPQLLAYALAVGPSVAALAAVHLRPRGVQWRGLVDRKGRLPVLGDASSVHRSWPELLGFWRQQLESLAAEFVAGHAEVAPRPQACAHCHLRLLCRIEQPANLAANGDTATEVVSTSRADDD